MPIVSLGLILWLEQQQICITAIYSYYYCDNMQLGAWVTVYDKTFKRKFSCFEWEMAVHSKTFTVAFV